MKQLKIGKLVYPNLTHVIHVQKDVNIFLGEKFISCGIKLMTLNQLILQLEIEEIIHFTCSISVSVNVFTLSTETKNSHMISCNPENKNCNIAYKV